MCKNEFLKKKFFVSQTNSAILRRKNFLKKIWHLRQLEIALFEDFRELWEKYKDISGPPTRLFPRQKIAQQMTLFNV